MFTDINIYPINNKTDHISEKYIFYRKKVKLMLIFSGRILSRIRIRYSTKRIRIRIHIKMKRIRNTDIKLKWTYFYMKYAEIGFGEISLTRRLFRFKGNEWLELGMDVVFDKKNKKNTIISFTKTKRFVR